MQGREGGLQCMQMSEGVSKGVSKGEGAGELQCVHRVYIYIIGYHQPSYKNHGTKTLNQFQRVY